METKISILKKKAELSGDLLPDDVAHFIASRSIPNIRELEGALIRVMAFSSLTKQPISLDLAQKVLLRTHHEVQSQNVDFDRIVRVARKHYSYSLDELKSKSRNKQLAFARQVVMFLMKKLTDRSLRDIGVFFGGRDHSTVMHAVNKVECMVKTDEILFRKLEMVKKEIVH